jgi:hypothetical protein
VIAPGVPALTAGLAAAAATAGTTVAAGAARFAVDWSGAEKRLTRLARDDNRLSASTSSKPAARPTPTIASRFRAEPARSPVDGLSSGFVGAEVALAAAAVARAG